MKCRKCGQEMMPVSRAEYFCLNCKKFHQEYDPLVELRRAMGIDVEPEPTDDPA